MGKYPSKAKLFTELDKIYFHPAEKGSYGGIQKLLTAKNVKGLRVSEKSIKDHLRRQTRYMSYVIHKPCRRNFKRNQTVVGGNDQQWQDDLADMQAISRKNKWTKYRITVIQVISKYA